MNNDIEPDDNVAAGAAPDTGPNWSLALSIRGIRRDRLIGRRAQAYADGGDDGGGDGSGGDGGGDGGGSDGGDGGGSDGGDGGSDGSGDDS